MSTGNIKVSIIIPVYSTLEKLEKCIASIILFENAFVNKIVIIGSDKEHIKQIEYLNNKYADYEIIYIYSEKDISSNINLGFEQETSDDSVILNGDTIVTKKWLDKLYVCAYSDAQIATVSPMTNGGGIFSAPEYNMETGITQGYSVDSFAELVEYHSMQKYPIVPYTSLICMYIKRSIINELHTFTAGCESDKEFCFRAIQLGYVNVMCDNTFIYYGGNEQTAGISLNHEFRMEYKLIFDELVDSYLKRESNKIINENIRMWMMLNSYSDRKNLLFFLLADFQEDASNNIGGTQLHVKDLTMNLKDVFNVYVLARDGENLRLTAWIGDEKFNYYFYIGNMPLFNVYFNSDLKRLYYSILKGFSIDIVHVHHTWGLSLDIYTVAKELELPLVLSIHDFYYICPTLRLMDKKGEGCTSQQPISQCAKCLWENRNINENTPYIEKWRKENEKIFQLCNTIVFPSQFAADTLNSFYKCIKTKDVKIIEHGIEVSPIQQMQEPYYKHHDKLRVAFIGGISEVKGADLIYDLITKDGSNKIQWYIMGGIGVVNLYTLEKDNLIKTGWYQKEDIGKMLHENEIDIVCILSIIGETFCYTLSEAVGANIPVVAKNVGALGSRMQKMQCGWLVNKDAGFQSVINLLHNIKDNEAEYMEKWYRTKAVAVCDIQNMVSSYKKVYEQYDARNKSGIDKENVRTIFKAFREKKEERSADIQEIEEINRELQATRSELTDLYQSILVRMAVRLRKWNFPGKERIKVFVKRIIKYK